LEERPSVAWLLLQFLSAEGYDFLVVALLLGAPEFLLKTDIGGTRIREMELPEGKHRVCHDQDRTDGYDDKAVLPDSNILEQLRDLFFVHPRSPCPNE
jgi:hypothetical protein